MKNLKWLSIFKNPTLNIPKILHFDLCCLVKIPLEATAETIGSCIYSRGCEERCSLFQSLLSNEVSTSCMESTI